MEATLTPRQALELAIERANGITALARMIPVGSHNVINQWRSNRVPADYCPRIEALTGVLCEHLRPDVPWGVLRSKGVAASPAPLPCAAASQGAANA